MNTKAATPMQNAPLYLEDIEACVDRIIAELGKDIRAGLPLALGKPVALVNALYARAKSDPSLKLTFLTALSLERPRPSDDIERRFLEPILDRVYDGCPELDYVADLHAGHLPPNVTVKEFYFAPGQFLNHPYPQQHYISSNYTHAARDVVAQGCNLALQLVAHRDTGDGSRYSLSSNPDTTPEVVERMREAGRKFLVVGVVNQQLPYMYHDADCPASTFDIVLDDERCHAPLFSTPKQPVDTVDYAIGLNASALIKDGGTLQIGIGTLADALVYGCVLRHREPRTYRSVLEDMGVLPAAETLIERVGGTSPFARGLYGASEMFVDGFMTLYREGILARHVYDFWALQRLVNDDAINPENIDAGLLDGMERLGVRVLRTEDFRRLQHHGVFRDDCGYDHGAIVAPDGERIPANVADPGARDRLVEKCLGRRLRNGTLLQAAFFLGENAFYRALREMPAAERRRIAMTGVDKVNQLDHNPRLYKAQRKDARFINTGLKATLTGAVASDGLENGQVISGVGGQYNFVAMAHHLLTGRSILMIRSVRGQGKRASSNIVWHYGHATIPRHLRDIVVTEYGIADLRSKSDNEVIKALVAISDARFQDELVDSAKRAGKLEVDYRIPEAARRNTPQRLETALERHRRERHFPAFPLGSELTETELALGAALRAIQSEFADKRLPLGALWRAWRTRVPAAAAPYLERMQLQRPRGLRQRLVARLIVAELRQRGTV